MTNETTTDTQLDPIFEIVINVSDIPRSVKWYTTSFNCQVVSQDLRRAVLRFQNITLVLALPSGEPRQLTFIRPDAHTLGELIAGGDGKKGTYLSDPTGNVVRILPPQN